MNELTMMSHSEMDPKPPSLPLLSSFMMKFEELSGSYRESLLEANAAVLTLFFKENRAPAWTLTVDEIVFRPNEFVRQGKCVPLVEGVLGPDLKTWKNYAVIFCHPSDLDKLESILQPRVPK